MGTMSFFSFHVKRALRQGQGGFLRSVVRRVGGVVGGSIVFVKLLDVGWWWWWCLLWWWWRWWLHVCYNIKINRPNKRTKQRRVVCSILFELYEHTVKNETRVAKVSSSMNEFTVVIDDQQL